jgi:hypothetical protein
MSLIIKPFVVSVSGFGDHKYFAKSRGKALSAAFRDFGSISDMPFGEFLKIARARKTDAPALFGTPITVSGREAFFVSCNRQYVQFVKPDSDIIFNSHPYDVLPETMRPASYGGPL